MQRGPSVGKGGGSACEVPISETAVSENRASAIRTLGSERSEATADSSPTAPRLQLERDDPVAVSYIQARFGQHWNRPGVCSKQLRLAEHLHSIRGDTGHGDRSVIIHHKNST